MKLQQVGIRGFKSFSSTEDTLLTFGDITIVLGANGAGKSNLVSFFKMLNFLTSGGLQQYVGRYGVDRLLHYGSKHTESISFELQLYEENKRTSYTVKLSHGLPDRLFISGEQVQYSREGYSNPQDYFLGPGVSESQLKDDSRTTSKVLHHTLERIRTYQFHDTSDSAHIKRRTYINDARYLRSDAGNLAAYLRMFKVHDSHVRYYRKIVRTIQRIMPQFGDFILDPLPGNTNDVMLNWTDNSGKDYVFGPDQISDGSLRFMALATLLLQPAEYLPKVIVIDEPELGLHPAAISELADMIKTASQHAQVIIATQSTRLIDEFGADQVVTVERDPANQVSHCKRLDEKQLESWLQRYSLSELWEKNVLGGQP